MKFFTTSIFLVLFCLSANGQMIEGKLTDIVGFPLIGASVQWAGTESGVTSDADGNFKISDEGISNRVLVINYIGFREERIEVGDITFWEIQMIEDNTLSEVQISAKSVATRFADGVNKVEVIGTREIERAACCSLAGCFNTNAAVETATTNIVTDSKELRVLGLSGVYNQILFDGMPFIKGLSFTYGAGSYPGTVIESIFISKGANSVLQGAESISGQINIIPKSAAKSPKWFFNVFANSFGESQYNINYMLKKSHWNNLTTVHLTTPAQVFDRDKDGFRDVVATNRMSVYNKWVYEKPESRFKTQIGLRFWDEERTGGQVDFDKNENKGSNSIYGQTIDLTQLDAYTKFNFQLTEDLSITNLNTVFRHENESYFGIKKYNAAQVSANTDLFLDYFFSSRDHNLKGGISFKTNKLKEEIELLEPTPFLSYEDEYFTNYDLPGAYMEAKFNFSPVTIIGGIRTDRYGQYGWKMAPRVMARAELTENTDLRFSVGKGIRNAHIFSEQISILSSNRILEWNAALRPEEAWTTGVNFLHTQNFENANVTISTDYYHTSFINQIFPHFHHAPRSVSIHDYYEPSASNSFHFENKLELYEQVDIKWSYNYLNVYRTIEGERIILPFVPKHRWMASASFNTKDDQWQLDFNYRWTGEKRLPETDEYPEQFQIGEYSESYSIFDLQLTKRWNKFDLYTGVENIFDFRQENPIMSSDDPFGPYFDPSFTWGPTKGREFYIGLRYSIQ